MLHDVPHAAHEESATATPGGRHCRPLVLVAFGAVLYRGKSRGDAVASALGAAAGRSAVLLAHALTNAQTVHELRPSLEHGLPTLHLFLLRCDVLCLPVRLTT